MKKNFLIVLTTLFCCLLFSDNLFGQDIITKKDGKKIKVIIKEISDTEVKYVDYRDVEGVIFVMDRSLIREIKFSYGEKLKEEAPGEDAAYFVDDRNQNIKLNFTAINVGYTILTYERAIDPNSSYEVTVKIPGLGIKRDFESLYGFGLTLGYKLKLGSVFKKNSYRPNHVLHGGYFRAVGGFIWSERTLGRFQGDRKTISTAGHLGLDFGKQWVIRDRAVIDIYLGYHYYGASTKRESNGGTFNDFVDEELRGGDLVGFNNNAFSIGLRIGGLFGNYGKAEKRKKKRKRKK